MFLSKFFDKRARLFSPVAISALSVAFMGAAVAQTALSDQPVLSNPQVPGNLAMPLSVEFPTAISVAHIGNYDTSRSRLGYFDPNKCYSYQYYAAENAATGQLSHFYPNGTATNFSCTGQPGRWSGNFLNWASMQTIDPFRWALTGGNRVTDTTTITILEKAYASNQGGFNNFPNRTTSGSALVSGATPFSWNNFSTRIFALGVRMRFSGTGNVDNGPTAYGGGAATESVTYDVAIRVKVCDAAAGLEANCRLYGSNYKPEGLIQQYSDRIRYSAFGYLNIPEADQGGAATNYQRDGGVMRARQKFVGPRTPRPGQSSIPNTRREWDPLTGIVYVNGDPTAATGTTDAADAAATNTQFGTSVANSGVINYLNKFGQQSGTYKTYDPVGELYYAALRYFMNQGNVSSWSDMSGANTATRNNWTDGFPVITAWDDPIQYACQANFILGIGDVNTHADKNVSGNTRTEGEPAKPSSIPSAVTTLINGRTQANAIGALEGREAIGDYNGIFGGSNNSFMISGLAYGAHVLDIRPDDAAVPQTIGRQSVTTYWLDVLEFQNYRRFNQYWYATKYGGFNVPGDFNAATVTAATFPGQASWSDGDTVGGNLGPDNIANIRPRNYFVASDPAAMVSGLTAAFNSIASQLRAATTSFSLGDSQVTTATTGNASYSAAYNGGSWVGTVVARQLNFTSDGVATQSQQWTTDSTLNNQFTGTGWTGRRVVTYSGSAGVPFRSGTGGVTATQLATLDTTYGVGNDSVAYLNYLRGDRSNEVGATGAPLGYRSRTFPSLVTADNPTGTYLLGDIAGSKVTTVGAPVSGYSDAVNPGYSAFVAAQATRTRMVYVGANDGMLHAFNGALSGTGAGSEVFAYVPSALFSGPSTPATPSVDGLASRGNPVFEHKALVDATAQVYDIDFARTGGAVTGTPTPQWRSVLIGGLGKGGRSYYAINVTSPQDVTAESGVNGWASRVLWEFPNASTPALAVAQMGFSYGQPVVTKTSKWGWVVVLPSGYNSVNGGSYLFFVNPTDGTLLETVTVGTPTDPSEGLAHVQSYVRDSADNTAESLYAGDLLGKVWRVNVRGTGTAAYPAPVHIASLTAPTTSAAQPVTTRPLIEIDPTTGRRFVLVGTGRLLDSTDIASTAQQSFYAIIDGTEPAFSTTAPFPLTRGNLVANTSTTLSASGVGSPPSATQAYGWFIDLGTGANTRAWRVVLDPATISGRVSFASFLTDGDTCTPAGSSRVYSVAFGTGESVLQNDAAYLPLAGQVIDLRYLCIGSQCNLYAGSRRNNGDPPQNEPEKIGTQTPVVPGLRRLNWRELPIVQ